jgi:hypothetical protein
MPFFGLKVVKDHNSVVFLQHSLVFAVKNPLERGTPQRDKYLFPPAYYASYWVAFKSLRFFYSSEKVIHITVPVVVWLVLPAYL